MASQDAVSERGELELKAKFAGAAEGTEIEQTYGHYIISQKVCMIITCRHQLIYIVRSSVLTRISYAGNLTGPKEQLRGGHEGEKQVTIFRYSSLKVFTDLILR